MSWVEVDMNTPCDEMSKINNEITRVTLRATLCIA